MINALICSMISTMVYDVMHSMTNALIYSLTLEMTYDMTSATIYSMTYDLHCFPSLHCDSAVTYALIYELCDDVCIVPHIRASAVISGNDPCHSRLSNLGPDECQAVRVARRQALLRPQARALRQPPATPGSLPCMAPGHCHSKATRCGTE